MYFQKRGGVDVFGKASPFVCSLRWIPVFHVACFSGIVCGVGGFFGSICWSVGWALACVFER